MDGVYAYNRLGEGASPSKLDPRTSRNIVSVRCFFRLLLRLVARLLSRSLLLALLLRFFEHDDHVVRVLVVERGVEVDVPELSHDA